MVGPPRCLRKGLLQRAPWKGLPRSSLAGLEGWVSRRRQDVTRNSRNRQGTVSGNSWSSAHHRRHRAGGEREMED